LLSLLLIVVASLADSINFSFASLCLSAPDVSPSPPAAARSFSAYAAASAAA